MRTAVLPSRAEIRRLARRPVGRFAVRLMISGCGVILGALWLRNPWALGLAILVPIPIRAEVPPSTAPSKPQRDLAAERTLV